MRTFPCCVVLFILCCPFNVFARTSEDLKVKLPHGGTLIGRYSTSHSGRGIRAFLGVPYAEPPINDLRFMAPVPARPWKGERLATRDSPICIQRDPFRRDTIIEGSEDCLYLSVYTPRNCDKNQRLPVMVFFHGGGWECGAGISDFYGPEFLLDNDIVYVSGNFRLGPLGFLSTETPDCPGNNGLKDQLEILKWVQNNIAAFGGDPNSVTIFGESAGGASVTYHMMSKASVGLFHKGISQSGTNLDTWAQPLRKGVAAARALKVAKLVHCTEDGKTWSKIMKCLRTRPAENITATIYDFFEWDFDPIIPFPPVVEPDVPGAFITHHPRQEKSPHGINIPWMAGITSDEGALKTAPLLNIPGLLEDFKTNFYKVLPIILYYDHYSQDIRNIITKKISEFYFNGVHNWDRENHQNLTNLFTDAWFLKGFDEYLRLRISAAGQVGPTYIYLFDHKGAASFTEIFHGGTEHFYGVCHAEELQYLFPVGKSLFTTAIPTEHDEAIRKSLVELWVNFAKFSNPTPDGSQFIKWPPCTSFPINYVRIGSQQKENWQVLKTEQNFLPERVEFWRNLNIDEFTESSKDEL